jgi:hypothetical protein
MEIDNQPTSGTNTINCNDYGDLSAASDTVNGNFALPGKDWLDLSGWQSNNGHHWDADSEVNGFSTECPSHSIP